MDLDDKKLWLWKHGILTFSNNSSDGHHPTYTRTWRSHGGLNITKTARSGDESYAAIYDAVSDMLYFKCDRGHQFE